MILRRILVGVGAFLLVGAAPLARIVPHPNGGPALIIPANSPVLFSGFDENGTAQFSGRFKLNGQFVYDCPADCEPPATEDDVELVIILDPELAASLPHWENRGDGMTVYIGDIDRLKHTIATKGQVDDLLSGKIGDISGHLSIMVDRFAADFGCDYSPYYSARFVTLVEQYRLTRAPVDANYGCL